MGFLVNPLTDHIKEKYEELFAMTQSCATILEQDWTISLTDDDIAYLTIHLGESCVTIIQSKKRPNSLLFQMMG